MPSTARPSLRVDETGNQYGTWTVSGYACAKRGKAHWHATCICGLTKIISGRNLRRGVLPRHKCIRVCRQCGRSETEVEFDKNRQVGNICLRCKSEFIKGWRNENAVYRSEYKREWNRRSPKKIRKYHYTERERVQLQPQLYLKYYYRTKVRTNRFRKSKSGKELPPRLITITEDEVCALWDKQEGRCAISGMQMLHRFNDPCTVSMDRIDSKIGYTPENTQLVCRWVNLAKNNFSDAEIRRVLDEFRSSSV
jgi:hypothetical protein